ncbi:hypothetical protein SH2C18_25710 [Clostridium sediminicola]|uniref:ATP-binding cassette domain-containing protein n=1 Tax=Clostridium sediminicola TaxID=3114879 RepID=UPI0031F1E733
MGDFIFKIENLKSVNLVGDNLKGLNLNIKSSEVHALVGSNDSITRTFIKSISGEEKDVLGKVIFKEENLDMNQINTNKDISFLFQESTLVDTLSVYENIVLNYFPKKRPFPFINWKRSKENAMRILEDLNFSVNYKQKVSKLSSEQKKIVYIAKIFYNNPELIIMYNPTEDLSSEYVQKLYQLIDKCKNEGKSILYVTKQWEEALKVGDRISILSEGVVKKTFIADEAKKNPQEVLNLLGKFNYKKSETKIDYESEEVLDAVFRAAEFLTSEYELKDVLLLLSKQVIKFMNADGCTIHLIDESTNTIIDTLEFKIKEELQAKLKEEFILNVVHKNDLYYSNKREKDYLSIFELNNKVKTIICVPVLIRSRVTGIIQIYYERLYAHSRDEAKYLSAFVRHAAIAIEDTRLMGRSALLQESHHRIKNNLQSIVNLIALQKKVGEKEKSYELDNILDNIISRIKSIAAVHDLLATDKLGRSIINIKDIVVRISSFFKSMNVELDICLELDDIFIPYNKATSIALIINELISNCLKHAFIGESKGIIAVRCKRLKDVVLLSVEDNGVGLPKDFEKNNMDSLGVSIVSSIAKYEFKGSIEFIPLEKGTKVEIKLMNDKVFVTYKKYN